VIEVILCSNRERLTAVEKALVEPKRLQRPEPHHKVELAAGYDNILCLTLCKIYYDMGSVSVCLPCS
jgi:hypothetical protein